MTIKTIANRADIMAVDTNDELVRVLSTSLYPKASKDSIGMVLSYCRQAELDPMQKPVHIVPMWDSDQGKMRDVVMPGIGLYRIQAARSGEYGGISEPEFGEDIEGNIGGTDITYPKWCKVTVTRLVSGQKVEFTAKELWLENYAVKGGKERSVAPNNMWSKRPYGQLAKCAEAQALRKAFPEFGAQPTAEEMEGKSYDSSNDERVVSTQDPISKELNQVANTKTPSELTALWSEILPKHQSSDHFKRLSQAFTERKHQMQGVQK